MKLFGKITNDKNGENGNHFEITEVVLVHCNIVNNNYQQDSRVVYTFVLNKSFSQLLDILPKHLIQNFNIFKVWFTDQNYKPLQIEDKTNITLVIN